MTRSVALAVCSLDLLAKRAKRRVHRTSASRCALHGDARFLTYGRGLAGMEVCGGGRRCVLVL